MRRDTEIRRELAALPMEELVAGQRQTGRAEMDGPFAETWIARYHQAEAVLGDLTLGRDTHHLAGLLKDVTFPLVAQREDPIPDYYPYTGVHLLEWYLGDRHQPWSRLKAHAAEGVFHTLLDLIRFESQSLAGLEPWHRQNLDREMIGRRLDVVQRAVERCRALGELVPGAVMDPTKSRPHRYETLGDYAFEPGRLSAMVELSMMPQTRYHDEVIFLRTIHIGEFCFFGIRVAIREAQELLRRDRLEEAVEPLRQATAFGAMLYESFKVLRTMPPEHFIDFREATGKASAIKSLNYQLLEIHLRGVSAKKVEVFHRIPHLRGLAKFAHPGFVHLRRVLGQADDGEAWGAVLDQARALDQKWLTWRGLHLSFALHYLPPHAPGTGDTEGAPYLRKFLRAGLFDDTEVDMALVEELFGEHSGIPDLFRARPSQAFAPVEELRAYRGD